MVDSEKSLTFDSGVAFFYTHFMGLPQHLGNESLLWIQVFMKNNICLTVISSITDKATNSYSKGPYIIQS